MKIFSLLVLWILERVWIFSLANAVTPSRPHPLSLPGKLEPRRSFHTCFVLAVPKRRVCPSAGLGSPQRHPHRSPADPLGSSRKRALILCSFLPFHSPVRNHTLPHTHHPLSVVNHVSCCGEKTEDISQGALSLPTTKSIAACLPFLLPDKNSSQLSSCQSPLNAIPTYLPTTSFLPHLPSSSPHHPHFLSTQSNRSFRHTSLFGPYTDILHYTPSPPLTGPGCPLRHVLPYPSEEISQRDLLFTSLSPYYVASVR